MVIIIEDNITYMRYLSESSICLVVNMALKKTSFSLSLVQKYR